MPSHESFVQGYNSQAAVATETMLITTTVTQQTNDKQQIESMPVELIKLPETLGQVEALLAVAGYFSAANVQVCEQNKIQLLIAIGRDQHPIPLAERPAPTQAV